MGEDCILLGDLIGLGGGHLAQNLMTEEGSGDDGQIICAGIMSLMEKTIGIHEVGIHTSQIGGGLIPQGSKILHGSADVLADGIGGFIGGAHQ